MISSVVTNCGVSARWSIWKLRNIYSFSDDWRTATKNECELPLQSRCQHRLTSQSISGISSDAHSWNAIWNISICWEFRGNLWRLPAHSDTNWICAADMAVSRRHATLRGTCRDDSMWTREWCDEYFWVLCGIRFRLLDNVHLFQCQRSVLMSKKTENLILFFVTKFDTKNETDKDTKTTPNPEQIR